MKPKDNDISLCTLLVHATMKTLVVRWHASSNKYDFIKVQLPSRSKEATALTETETETGRKQLDRPYSISIPCIFSVINKSKGIK